MHSKVIFSIIAALAATSAASPAIMMKRDPSDKSGNSKLSLECESTTIPNPGGAGGAGEGGTGLFNNLLTFTDPAGTNIAGSCGDDDGYCETCTFSGDSLSEDISVKSCFNPLAGNDGCSIVFDYEGMHYDSQASQPQCGHEGGGFEAFSSSIQAVCYFNTNA